MKAKKPIIIIGGGGHAKVLIDLIQNLSSYTLLGYIDPKNKGDILGCKYLGDDSAIPKILKKHKKLCAALGIGKILVGSKRHEILKKYQSLGLPFPALVAKTATVSKHIEIGEGSVVMSGAVVQAGTKIGKIVILNSNCSIDHDCYIEDDVHIAPGASLSGEIHVGAHSLIGTGASIKQGIKISADCTIGVGAAVISDCNHKGIYVGVPAKKIK